MKNTFNRITIMALPTFLGGANLAFNAQSQIAQYGGVFFASVAVATVAYSGYEILKK